MMPSGTRVFLSFCIAILSTLVLSSCFVVTKIQDFVLCPSSRQKAGETRQRWKVFCCFSSSNKALLCYLGGTYSSANPTEAIYAITMIWLHTPARESVKVFSAEGIVTLNKKKIWNYFRKEKMGMSIKQASSRGSHAMEFKVYFSISLCCLFKRQTEFQKEDRIQSKKYCN